MYRFLIALCISLSANLASAAEPARVLLVGTYHFGNPGRDINNVRSVDVMTPQRQAELQAITDHLARFGPTLVAVEQPADKVGEVYAKYLDSTLPPVSSESVQLGFRLARQSGLEQVHGIDVAGDFPFGPVQEWVMANKRGDELQATMQAVQERTERISAMQETHTIGEVLRTMNTPSEIEKGHAMYAQLLRYGSGDDQPGVALNAAWAERNLAICARLLQALKPGDRAVVFYGDGHLPQLHRCIAEAPAAEVVDALDYLPDGS